MEKHSHLFVQSYDGPVAFGFSREVDEAALTVYLQKFSDDGLMEALCPRLSDDEIHEIRLILDHARLEPILEDVPRALMTPVVRVRASPKGLPMAKTACPTARSVDVPTGIGWILSGVLQPLHTPGGRASGVDPIHCLVILIPRSVTVFANLRPFPKWPEKALLCS